MRPILSPPSPTATLAISCLSAPVCPWYLNSRLPFYLDASSALLFTMQSFQQCLAFLHLVKGWPRAVQYRAQTPCYSRATQSKSKSHSCADCDAELKDYGNIWASVEQGCFVCVHCVAGHRALGFRTKSVNMDLWAVDEVARMTAMGNLKVQGRYGVYPLPPFS